MMWFLGCPVPGQELDSVILSPKIQRSLPSQHYLWFYDLCMRKDVKCSQELYRMSLIISFSYYCPLYHCLSVPAEPSVTDTSERWGGWLLWNSTAHCRFLMLHRQELWSWTMVIRGGFGTETADVKIREGSDMKSCMNMVCTHCCFGLMLHMAW